MRRPCCRAWCAPTTSRTRPPRPCRRANEIAIRPLTHADPLRLWVGGDSLSGALGPALGDVAGATGIVDTYIDYKVSSGLVPGVRNWQEYAAQAMDEHDPEAVVFMIGTNDAIVVNSQDANDDGVHDWEVDYREQVANMMDLLVGGEKKRTVIWIGAPTMRDARPRQGRRRAQPGDAGRSREAQPVRDLRRRVPPVRRRERRVLTDRLDDRRRARCACASATACTSRPPAPSTSRRPVFALLDGRFHLTAQADPSHPIDCTMQQGGESTSSGGSGSGTGRGSGRAAEAAAESAAARRPSRAAVRPRSRPHPNATRELAHDGRAASPTTDPPTDAATRPRRRRRTPAEHTDRARRRAVSEPRSPRRSLPRMSDQLSAARAAVDTRRRRRGRAPRAPRRARRPRTARSPSPSLDEHQALAYDLAHAAAAVEGSKVMCAYGEHGEVESMLARAYVADAIADVATRIARPRRPRGASTPPTLAPALPFVEAHRAPEFLDALGRAVREARHRPDPPLRRLRARRRHVPPLRRGQDPARRRARAPHERRRARGDHQRPRRARRLRPVGARGVRRLGDRRRAGLHRHGRRDRGAVARLARHRRLARHPPRDPHARAGRGRHRGAEAAVAAAHRDRRADGRDHGDRTRLRLRRRRREGHGRARRRRLARQRRQDVGDVRGPRRRADAARAHRPRPHRRATAACRCSSSRSRAPRVTRSSSRTAAAGRWKAARSTRSATAACTRTRSRSRTGSCPPRTSSAATPASAAASTSRWPASRTAVCRPRRARSA